MLGYPTLADPQIAAATFQQHLDDLWENRRPGQLNWELHRLDDLHVVIGMPALRNAGTDLYYIKLGGEYYDAFPPTTSFVSPPDWTPASGNSRWFPRLANLPPWFGLNAAHQYPDGKVRQIVCFTFTAEYYMTSHSPEPHTVWRQGYHTLAVTLNRINEMLRPPYYQGSADATHS